MNKAVKLVILALLLSVLLIAISFQVGMQLERTRSAGEISALRERLAKAESTLLDWPQLRRYAEANRAIQPPQPSETRVVFIGDSITSNWSGREFGGFFPQKPYINRGIDGQITGQMLARFRQDVIALNPRVVVILGGTNDFQEGDVETAFNNLASMAELAEAHHILVVLASVLPVNDYSRRADGQPLIQTRQERPAKIIELNNRLRNYASAQGFTYLDYYSALVDDKGMLKADLSSDGVHPNAQGYAVMAPLAEQAIDSALRSKGK
ncbi:MAG TPA: SGNH/GDSL hydrolase family protein [Pyrinomonadaceae bacterium]|jgi:lysophospholipase L1-like esterase